MARAELIRRLVTACFAAAALNVIALAITGHYDLHLGIRTLRIEASTLFKPLLYLNGAFLLALTTRPAKLPKPGPGSVWDLGFWAPAAAIVAVAYGVSFRINLECHDWTFRALTAGSRPLNFFTAGQYDGFYRPLTFLSFWLDNRVFGAELWAYHIQNILLHLLNGELVMRLALRLGLGASTARSAGLLFLGIPAAFEAVIWPGARFDLLAAAFTLFAVEQALAGSIGASVASYALGALSKESAYCYPLIVGGLYLLRGPLGLVFDRARMRAVLQAAVAATIVLIGVRFAVYGELRGKPGTEAAETTGAHITQKTFTAIPSRLPAALFIVNSEAGLPLWMRLALGGYTLALCGILASGAGLGARAALLLIALLAAAPTVNILGWINPAAQQSRYLYQPAVWIVLALASSLASARHGQRWGAVLIVCMTSAALFNTLAYLRMVRVAEAIARDEVCADLPNTLYGAFYFREEAGERYRQRTRKICKPGE